MTLSTLKELLNQHAGDAVVQANLLNFFAQHGGSKFDSVEDALAA